MRRVLCLVLVVMLFVTGSGVTSVVIATPGETGFAQTADSSPLPPSAMDVEASSWGSYSGNDRVPKKAVDGTDETAWGGTEGGGDWLRIRLDKKYTLDHAVIDVGYHSMTYDVQVSQDGNSWQTVASDIRTPGNHHVEDESKTVTRVDLQDTQARYVRINVKSTNAPGGHIWQAIIEEVYLYPAANSDAATPQATPQPTPTPTAGVSSGGSTQATPNTDSTSAPTQSPAPESRLLLDSNSEHLGTVTVNGQTYTVVKYENTLPYASGVEVYRADGTRITSTERARPALEAVAARQVLANTTSDNVQARAKAVAAGQATQTFQSLAWRRAASQLSPDDISTLQNIRQTTTSIEQVVDRPEAALERILQFVETLKNKKVLGQSAWALATKAAPSLKGFEQAARGLHSELEAWKEAAAKANANIPKVVTALKKVKQGKSVDYDQLSRQFATTMDALDRLERQSSQVASKLSKVASISGKAARKTNSVPVIGGKIASEFRDVQQTLQNAESRISSFSQTLKQQKQQLGDVRSTAQSRTEKLNNQWEQQVQTLEDKFAARKDAKMKVYGTLGGGAVAGLLLLGFVYRRLG